MTYWTALSYEAAERYEEAQGVLNGILPYGDVKERLATYPGLINARDYRRAEQLEASGKLKEARAAFTALGSYSDSAARAQAVAEAMYTKADQLEATGYYTNARTMFTDLNGYRDSAARIRVLDQKIAYVQADRNEQAGKLQDALQGFTALGSFSDSAQRAEQVREKIHMKEQADAYAAAEKLYRQRKLFDAIAAFDALGDYSDSAQRAAAIREEVYLQAETLLAAGDTYKAYQLFVTLNGYRDSTQRAAEIYQPAMYQYALVCIEAGQYQQAYDTLALIRDYADSEEKYAGLSVLTVAQGYTLGSGMFAYTFHDGAGLVNLNDNVRTEPRWDEVRLLTEDTFLLTKGGKLGLMSTAGTQISDCRWDMITVFEGNHVLVRDGDNLGLMDRLTGDMFVPCEWKSIASFSDRYILVGVGSSYGLIAKADGSMKLACEWASIVSISGQLLLAEDADGLYSLVRKADCAMLDDGKYSAVTVFARGLLKVRYGAYEGLLSDADASVVLPVAYSEVTLHGSDRALLLADGLYGLADLTGSILIPCEMKVISAEGSGFYTLAKVVDYEYRFGLADRNGNVLIDCTLSALGGSTTLDGDRIKPPTFTAGWMLACADDGVHWGAVDSKGRLVVPLEYAGVEYLSNGRAAVTDGERWGYVDAEG